jgi:polysaccharide deacetylase 2 family uncharacterized protein YibQ
VFAAFWLILLLAGGGGAGWLQYTDAARHVAPPPAVPQVAAPTPPLHEAEARAPQPTPLVASSPATPPAPDPVVGSANRPGVPIPGPIAALLEPSPGLGGAGLPRTAPGQKPPMQAYAGGFDPLDHRPRIALLLTGIGLSDPDSEDAIRQLPAGVTLGISPYASRPEPLLEKARARGHEMLISIPMEARGYPMNDEGPHALLTGATSADNRERLDWTLSRIAGYAGATGALDGMRGERFAASGEQMLQVLDELAGRGLYYIDPRPGEKAPLHIRGRSVDLLVDEPPVGVEIEAKLAQLERIARDKGQALGLAGMPRPVTLERIAGWAGQLESHGFALVPVSALMQPMTAAQR